MSVPESDRFWVVVGVASGFVTIAGLVALVLVPFLIFGSEGTLK